MTSTRIDLPVILAFALIALMIASQENVIEKFLWFMIPFVAVSLLVWFRNRGGNQ